MKCTTDFNIHKVTALKVERTKGESGREWIEVTVIHDGEKFSMTAFLRPDATVEVVGNVETAIA